MTETRAERELRERCLRIGIEPPTHDLIRFAECMGVGWEDLVRKLRAEKKRNHRNRLGGVRCGERTTEARTDTMPL